MRDTETKKETVELSSPDELVAFINKYPTSESDDSTILTIKIEYKVGNSQTAEQSAGQADVQAESNPGGDAENG